MLNNNFLDAEHKFDLATQLGDLDCAYTLVKESASEQKWKQLDGMANSQAKFELAQQCLHEAQGHVVLLLLAAGNADMVARLGAPGRPGWEAQCVIPLVLPPG